MIQSTEDNRFRQVNGEPTEFVKLRQQYFRSSVLFARRLTGNMDAADDLAQEAWLKAWKSFDEFRGDAKFNNWLYRIVLRTYLDFVRGRKNLVSLDSIQNNSLGDLNGDSSKTTFSDPLLDSSADPAKRCEVAALSESVWILVNNLPEKLRAAAVLRHFEDLEYNEIAELLSIPIGTVKSRLYDARAMLRDCVSSNSDARVLFGLEKVPTAKTANRLEP